MAHKEKLKINWNKDVKYDSKQHFIDANKEAWPDLDLGAEYDAHIAPKVEKPVKVESAK